MINFLIKYKVHLLLGLILLVGFYRRIGGILTNSFAFTYDVGRDLLQVQQIVVDHKIPLIGQTTGLGGLFYGPWWYYMLTPAFIISGGNPQGVALSMVLVGMITIFFGFVLGKQIHGNRLGLLFAALTAFSPVMIGYSAQIWNPNIAPLLVLIVLYSLLAVHKNVKNWKWYILLGFILGLIIDTEIVFGVLFFVSTLCLYFWFEKKKALNRNVLFIAVGFLVTLAPRIFFELRHGFIMTQTLLHPASGSEKVFEISNFLTDFPNRALALFGQYRDTFTPGNTLLAMVLLGTTAIFTVWQAKKLKSYERFFFVACFIVVVVFLIGTSFFSWAIWGHYLVGLPVFYLLSFAIVLDVIWKKLKYLSFTMLIILLWFMINPIQIVSDAQRPLWEGNAAVYRNQVAVIDYIYNQAKGKKFNEIVYTPSVHDFPYQYLFSWYGKNKYGYVPSMGKEKLFFVTIEQDPGQENRIKDWLKIREGDGKVIKEEVVRGGITVQTRIH